jgi:hypothetical protein
VAELNWQHALRLAARDKHRVKRNDEAYWNEESKKQETCPRKSRECARRSPGDLFCTSKQMLLTAQRVVRKRPAACLWLYARMVSRQYETNDRHQPLALTVQLNGAIPKDTKVGLITP